MERYPSSEVAQFERESFLRNFSKTDVRAVVDYQDQLVRDGKPIEEIAREPIPTDFAEKFKDTHTILGSRVDMYDDVVVDEDGKKLDDNLFNDLLVQRFRKARREVEESRSLIMTEDKRKYLLEIFTFATRVRLNALAYIDIDSPLSPKFIKPKEPKTPKKDNGESEKAG